MVPRIIFYAIRETQGLQDESSLETERERDLNKTKGDLDGERERRRKRERAIQERE